MENEENALKLFACNGNDMFTFPHSTFTVLLNIQLTIGGRRPKQQEQQDEMMIMMGMKMNFRKNYGKFLHEQCHVIFDVD